MFFKVQITFILISLAITSHARNDVKIIGDRLTEHTKLVHELDFHSLCNTKMDSLKELDSFIGLNRDVETILSRMYRNAGMNDWKKLEKIYLTYIEDFYSLYSHKINAIQDSAHCPNLQLLFGLALSIERGLWKNQIVSTARSKKEVFNLYFQELETIRSIVLSPSKRCEVANERFYFSIELKKMLGCNFYSKCHIPGDFVGLEEVVYDYLRTCECPDEQRELECIYNVGQLVDVIVPKNNNVGKYEDFFYRIDVM